MPTLYIDFKNERNYCYSIPYTIYQIILFWSDDPMDFETHSWIFLESVKKLAII